MRFTRECYLLSCLALLAAAQAPAQVQAQHTLALETSDADVSAAQQSHRSSLHLLPTAGHRATRDNLAGLGLALPPPQVGPVAPVDGVRYPGTLTYQGGPVMTSAVQHTIFMFPRNGVCPSVAACWGDPERFLTDLSRSEFIHVTDQYVDTTANDRYPVGVGAHVRYTIPAKPLVDTDMQAVVHALVVRDGGLNGYGHEYHVFLPPGQDECFDTTFKVCASNVFCAYHGSVDFKDVGHVVYSVEPFGERPGCNSLQLDGSSPPTQNSLLSHELIESITDPDGDAWWNFSGDLDLLQFEIGDECQWVNFQPMTAGFLLDEVSLNGRQYFIQSEYNDHSNGCTDGPHSGGD